MYCWPQVSYWPAGPLTPEDPPSLLSYWLFSFLLFISFFLWFGNKSTRFFLCKQMVIKVTVLRRQICFCMCVSYKAHSNLDMIWMMWCLFLRDCSVCVCDFTSLVSCQSLWTSSFPPVSTLCLFSSDAGLVPFCMNLWNGGSIESGKKENPQTSV